MVWLVRWMHEGSVGFCLRQAEIDIAHYRPPTIWMTNGCRTLLPFLLSVPESIATQARPGSGCSVTPSLPSCAGHMRVKQSCKPRERQLFSCSLLEMEDCGKENKDKKRKKVAFTTPIPSYASHTWEILFLREIPEVFTSGFYTLL